MLRSLFFLTTLLLCIPIQAADTALKDTGSVFLTLEGGLETVDPSTLESRDVEMELVLRGGVFEKPAWAWAIGFNKTDHIGEIVKTEGETLSVKLVLRKDKWFPSVPGEANYQITLKRAGDNYTGTFTGNYTFSSKEGPVTREVAGKVTGKLSPLWTETFSGFQKLEPNEHPRLIFRKSDLPMIKKRLETPQGKVIMERFMAMLPRMHSPSDENKTAAYLAANYGVAYQLTGDKAHADKAKEVLGSMLNNGGSQDIHFGPEAQSFAITLDMCYDAWDAVFRQKVIDNLAKRVSNLDTLSGMGGASLSPWHNHEGVRGPSNGVAAICLLGEKTSNPKDMPDLERIIHATARGVRRYFQYSGNTDTGFCLEGNYYKRMTWNSGPAHMIQAYRTAFGGNLLAGGLGHSWYIGEWMSQAPSAQVVTADELGDHQTAGLWPLGLALVPESSKAGVRWLFDRTFGLEGNKSFGILWAYHAAYVLMNYPFEVESKAPSESLPWIAPDPVGGRWILRRPWKDAQDSLVVMNLRSALRPGCHYYRSGRTWDMQLFALGKQWIGPKTVDSDHALEGLGSAMPTTANLKATNPVLGPKTTWWQGTDDGRFSLALNNDYLFLQLLGKGEVAPAETKPVKTYRFGTFYDHGIRAKRFVAFDFSGASGAPVVMVMIDQTQGAKDYTWNLQLSADAGAGKVDGNAIVAGDEKAANLRCTFVGSKPLKLSGKMKAEGADEYFAIITIQNGAAPVVKVDGEGLNAKVSVGGQTVRFDGSKIILGKE